MKTRSNRLMDEYLEALQYNFLTTTVQLPIDFEKFLQSDFLTDNDCIILKGLYNNFFNPQLNTDIEKSEWEYNETHFHPSDYAKDDELEYLAFALESAKRIMLRLEQQFLNKKFRVIISFSKTEIKDGEVEIYGSSTVRFYQVRPNSERIMRIEDINDYKSDAVLEIEL